MEGQGTPIGHDLDDFELVECLGRGGMGEVHLARQRSLDRLVALKLIRRDLAASSDARQRFRRETRALAILRRPGVVPIHAVGEHDGRPWFAMELLSGLDLARVVPALRSAHTAGERLSGDLVLRVVRDHGRDYDRPSPKPGAHGREDRASHHSDPLPRDFDRCCATLVARAARAIAGVHEQGLLHRDLKPANLILDRHGRLTIVDFGLVHDASSESLTRPEAWLGSLPYLAPECLRGEPANVPTRDVYGLGMVLHELLTLRPAFDGTEADLTRLIVEGAAAPLRRDGSRIETDLAAICRTATDLDPRHRYSTADALADDLQRFLDRRGVHARPAGPVRRLTRWARRRPATATAGGAAIVLLIGGPLLFAGLQLLHVRRLETALQTSESARVRYVDALGGSLDVVHGVARRTIDDPEVDRRGTLDPLRSEALAELADYYESLLRHDPLEPRISRQLVESQTRLAELHRQLGELPRALEAARRAVHNARAVDAVATPTDRPSTRMVLAGCLRVQAGLLSELGDQPGSEQHHREAVALLESTGANQPDHPGEEGWLESRTALANHLTRTDRFDEALAALDELLQHMGERAHDPTSEVTLRAALLHTNRCSLLSQLGRVEDSIAAAGTAITLYQARLAQNPDAAVELDLGLAYNARADRHRELGEWQESIGDLRSAEELLRRATARWPHRAGPRQRLCGALNSLGSSLAMLGETTAADAILAEAIERARSGATRKDRELLADALMARAQLLAPTASGKAVEVVDEAIRLFDELADDQSNSFANRAVVRSVATSVHLARRDLGRAREIAESGIALFVAARERAPNDALTRLQHGKALLQAAYVSLLCDAPEECRARLQRAVDDCGTTRELLRMLEPALGDEAWFTALMARAPRE